MNYKVTKQWQKMSDIMDQDYDATKVYRIHSNIIPPANLCLTEVSSPAETINGRLIPRFSEVYVSISSNPYLKVIEVPSSISSGFDIEISEVDK